jgi:Ca2+:H+ antiporter
MGETDEPSLSRSVKSKTTALRLGRKKDATPVLPTHQHAGLATSNSTLTEKQARDNGNNNVAHKSLSSSSTPAASSDGEAPATVEKVPMPLRMQNGIVRFGNHTKRALLHSWVNVLLIFVPIGIAVYAAKLSPVIVFSMNAVAIIPLAGLLAHATEAVAARLGDTLGALLNVSFGNAVELILFIILLAEDQIEVVQAALLGSILANLLLILGMAFLLGGLRYQEQVGFVSSFFGWFQS